MDVNDDVLGLILERVDSQVSLIRAAAVCRRWRRAVADPAFLRRFRSLHAPAVAGHYHNEEASASGGQVAVFVPSSPPVVQARHFSLDFLDRSAGPWTVWDSRGSLLLMQGKRNRAVRFPVLVVCEPLTRRCKIIPPLAYYDRNCHFLRTFLVDGCINEAGGRISMPNFRVLCLFRRQGHICTAMFTLADEWTMGHSALTMEITSPLGRAGGYWYFYVDLSTLMVLDCSTGNLSSLVLPPFEDWDLLMWSNLSITTGRDGKPRIVTALDDTMKVFVQINGSEWALEKSLLLSKATQGLPGYQPSFFSNPMDFLTMGVGFVILSPEIEVTWPFSVDLETLEVAPAAENFRQLSILASSHGHLCCTPV